MLSQKMLELGTKSSVIREIFEYAKKRRSEIGDDKVFDFSIGNPSIPAPQSVTDAIMRLCSEKDPVALHGYTSAVGDLGVRTKIADYIKGQFGVEAKPTQIYMTCGAAASLTITLNAIINPGDEVIVLAPFFPEYRVFAEKAGAKLCVVKCREEDFQIDFEALQSAINENTKAIIVNSPNNPTGVVFSRDTVEKLADLLNEKQKQFGKTIFLIADEPYRELAYGVEVPYLPAFYDNTVVCYSYSKSLSLPGERIGYIFVPSTVCESAKVYAAVCGAGRSLGFVCAPSLLQYVIGECIGETSDVSVYQKNRDIFYNALTDMGYKVAKPDGAFYLFMKALEADANAFCEKAKKYELLLVPSDSFGYEGYVRIAYCLNEEQITRALPAFEALIKEYK
ncbi:MAG: pyridoxal phosphate-dependent aminotransferase [Ruminococcaceae bacterium]|nr:pyridoxal phosphate-dependent aminotransferase [Oscillospiraceae bacterium]